MQERIIVWKQFGETVIDPIALGFTLLMGVVLFAARRPVAAVPLVLVACFMPVEQRLVVAGLDFDMVRVILLFGLARIVIRDETRNLHPNRVDAAFAAWIASGTIFYFLRELSVEALIYRVGVMFDALGTFFLLRALLRDLGDARRVVQTLSWSCVLLAVCMAVEHVTGRNAFAVFGGVDPQSIVRDGTVRAQGSFSHPIMAGSFGASCVPLIVALLRGPDTRLAASVAGLAGALVVTLAAASSGAVLALAAAFVGIALWSLRGYLRPILWGFAAMLLVLHLVREKPVWHLIGRASDLIGGTGYHRYQLIDAFVNNWREWFLVGTRSTAHWGWGLQDLTNQWVYEGVQGGLVTLLCFQVLLVLAFAGVGTGLRRGRRRDRTATAGSGGEFFAWALGVSLVTHCVSWVSVSYFGQMTVLLYLLLATISSCSAPAFWGVAIGPRVRTPRPARPRPAPPEPAPSSAAGASLARGLTRRRT